MVGRKIITKARINDITQGEIQYKSTRVKNRHVISGNHSQIPKMQPQPAIYNRKEQSTSKHKIPSKPHQRYVKYVTAEYQSNTQTLRNSYTNSHPA